MYRFHVALRRLAGAQSSENVACIVLGCSVLPTSCLKDRLTSGRMGYWEELGMSQIAFVAQWNEPHCPGRSLARILGPDRRQRSRRSSRLDNLKDALEERLLRGLIEQVSTRIEISRRRHIVLVAWNAAVTHTSIAHPQAAVPLAPVSVSPWATCTVRTHLHSFCRLWVMVR